MDVLLESCFAGYLYLCYDARFTLLDADGSGAIGLDELVDPLMSTGIASSHQEVLELVKKVNRR